MPDITPLVLSSDVVDPGEIYEEGIYNPETAPDTLEILNGGLTVENYSAGLNSLPAWACQMGAFAQGWYVGFDRLESTYARQLADDDNDAERVIHAGCSVRLFLPWDASVLLYGFQGFFQQDATVWDRDNSPGPIQPEYWDLRVTINEGTQQQLYTRLPSARQTTSVATSTSVDSGDPGMADETRWKWASKMGMLNTGLTKGFRTVQITIWAKVIYPDQCIAKLKTSTGGVWMLALR